MTDAPVIIRNVDMAVFDAADQTLERSIIIGSPDMVFEFILELRKSVAARGYALAKLLYHTRKTWSTFNIEGEFEDVVFERTGLSRQTVVKYVRMWENLFDNPNIAEKTKMLLMGRNIRDSLLLSAGAADGTLDDDMIRFAAITPDSESLREIVRKARGQVTSSSTFIQLSVVTRADNPKLRCGTVLARRGDEQVEIGWLDVETSNELAKTGILRVINSSNIREV